MFVTFLIITYFFCVCVCALFFRHVRIILISGSYLRHVRPSVRPSACIRPTAAGRIFVKFHIDGFYESVSGKFKFG